MALEKGSCVGIDLFEDIGVIDASIESFLAPGQFAEFVVVAIDNGAADDGREGRHEAEEQQLTLETIPHAAQAMAGQSSVDGVATALLNAGLAVIDFLSAGT